MTAAPQPLGRLTTVLEHIVRGIAWTTQASAATVYLIIALRPSAWQHMLDKDPVDAIFMWVFTIAMAAMWMLSLWQEQQRFYDRLIQRSCRRIGLTCHLGVAGVAVLTASQSPDRLALWLVLGMLCFAAFATWVSWIQTRFLPDEDQAVINAIISREAAQRAAIHDASERERRRGRLTAIVASLGYSLTDAPPQADKPAEAPEVRWTIPAGKHTPLVYFIRNGNRMKIGTTTELKRRIRTLALRPENVTLLVDGDQRREREYHKQFAEHRVGDTEWFAYEGTLADYIHDQTALLSRKDQHK